MEEKFSISFSVKLFSISTEIEFNNSIVSFSFLSLLDSEVAKEDWENILK